MNRFDRLFRRRLWKLIRPYWLSNEKWAALELLTVLVLISATLKGTSVWFSFVNRDLMTAGDFVGIDTHHNLR